MRHDVCRRPSSYPDIPTRTRALRIAPFITCFNDTLFPQTGRAAVEVAGLVGAALGEGRIPIVLGGDQSTALGTPAPYRAPTAEYRSRAGRAIRRFVFCRPITARARTARGFRGSPAQATASRSAIGEAWSSELEKSDGFSALRG
jgi:hypothetical protein